jgi:hypothetical protein
MTQPNLNIVRRPETRPPTVRVWIDCRLKTPMPDDMPVLVYAQDLHPGRGVPKYRFMVAYSMETFRPKKIKGPFSILYWMPGKGVFPPAPGA